MPVRKPVIGWDTETRIIKLGEISPPIACATFAGGDDTAMALQQVTNSLPEDRRIWHPDGNGGWVLLVGAPDVPQVMRAFLKRDYIMVAHNLAFDYNVIVENFPDMHRVMMEAMLAHKLRDTMVRETLLGIAFDTGVGNFPSLSQLAAKYLRKRRTGKSKADALGNLVSGDPASWRLRYGELIGVPLSEWPKAAVDYAIEDADDARQIFIKQGRRERWSPAGIVVNADGDVTNEMAQTGAAVVLGRMGCEGMCIDANTAAQFEMEVRKTAAKNDDTARRLGVLRVNRCKTCGGTGYMGAVPNLRLCYTCWGAPAAVAEARGMYITRSKRPFSDVNSSRIDTARLKEWVTHAYRDGADPTAIPRTKSGKISTSTETLRESGNVLLMEYSETLAALKMLSTYVPILHRAIEDGVRLTSSPNFLVRSGRTSWSKPNLQNPPRKGLFRECFVAAPGNVFCSIDYNSLELSTLAQVLTELHKEGAISVPSKLAELINSDIDPHLWFGLLMLNAERVHTDRGVVQYAEAKAAKSDKNHPLHALIKKFRQWAKMANFGFPGGLGVRTFIRYAMALSGGTVRFSFDEATWLREQWLTAFPEMREYFTYISRMSRGDGSRQKEDKQTGDRYTVFPVQQQYSGRIRGGCTYTSACNTFFQGLAADGAKYAMWELYCCCYVPGYAEHVWSKHVPNAKYLYGVKLVLFIHDENFLEGSEATAHLWAPAAADIMVRCMRRYTPDVKEGAEPALSRRWYKDAEPVYINENTGAPCRADDPNAKLVPWEPRR